MGDSSDGSQRLVADVDTRPGPSQADTERPAIRGHTVGLLALAWAAFIVYGSLLPFDYVPHPFAIALDRFRHIPLLEIGPGGRVDWMANLLLYVPLAFLSFASLSASRSRAFRMVRGALVLATLCAMATAIEFAQIFFPPRTVSLNDLIAEWLGILIGAGSWLFFGTRARAAQLTFAAGGVAAAGALVALYAIIYVGLALFPFDFMLTAVDFGQKDFSKTAGWWLAPLACVRALQCETQLFAEALFALPLGAAFVAARPRAARPTMYRVVVLGFFFGLAIELAQLLLGSGISQGASVAAKAIGFIAGGLAAPRIARVWHRLDSWSGLRPVLALLALVYLAALVWTLNLSHAFAIPWQDAVKRFADMPMIPFYNYYYTSETRALASLVFQASLYLPPGVLMALATRGTAHGIGQWLAGAASGALALVVQVARLFHPPQRFDPTDVLIAIFAGVVAYRFTKALLRSTHRTKLSESDAAYTPPAPRRSNRPGASWLPLALTAIAIAIFIATFPVARLELAVGIVACWWLIIRRPESWLVIVLALLPTLDLTQWSGRYYVDEFDAFALASFVGAAVRLRSTPRIRWPRWLTLLFVLFAVSGFISIVRGAVPWPGEVSLDLGGYQNKVNAFRVGRGIVWACALLWLLSRTEPKPMYERSGFVLGMTIGLLGVGLIVLWERIVFTGPFNFTHEYRVSGTFSAISTAGAQIESYLAAATPFAILLALRAQDATRRLLGLAALILMCYAVAATASRSAYGGVSVSAGIMALAWLWSRQRMGRKLFVGLLATAFVVLAWSLTSGTFVKHRMADVGRDFAERESHWALVVQLMDTDWVTRTFGMGMGQYPSTFLWKMPGDRRPATFAFLREADRSLLRLGAGHFVYMDQFVPVEHGQTYVIRGRIRARAGDDAVLNIALCDKWILYSMECVAVAVHSRASGDWASFDRPLDARDLGSGPALFQRPVKLSIYNGGTNTLDVTDLSLENAQGRNILVNGNFADGSDHWYFSADDHFPWNIFNLFVEVFFEQGWLGLITLLALLCAVIGCLAARAACGNLVAIAFLASLGGFMVPGLFDSVIDDPRMRLLLLMLLCASVLLTGAEGANAAGDKRPLRQQ